MKTILTILIISIVSTLGFSQRRSNDEFKEGNTIKEYGYYDSGTIKYYNKTRRVGLKPNNKIEGKQVVILKEYYWTEQIEFKEKKKLPKIKDKEPLSDERHLMKQRRVWRKYKKWNWEGEVTEKGKYNYRGGKRVVMYNFMDHKKVIIKYDKELNMDVYIKKKPYYKNNNKPKKKYLDLIPY